MQMFTTAIKHKISVGIGKNDGRECEGARN